ncbi:MAG TPA: hypothetical protein VEI26_09750 [Terriglobales bacterium]|nr:hypothetical protein [Terriglobales bacterium]
MKSHNSPSKGRQAQARKRAPARRKANDRIVKPRSPRYSSLTPREKATRERALNLLSDLRRGEGSYRGLLRKYQLDTRTAHTYLGRNLLGGAVGKRVRATKADKLVRELMFPTSFGDLPVRTHSSRDATKLSDFYHDRDNLLRGKLSADAFEAKWRGVRVARQELFADASAILEMANAGELKLENLYASTGGAR